MYLSQLAQTQLKGNFFFFQLNLKQLGTPKKPIAIYLHSTANSLNTTKIKFIDLNLSLVRLQWLQWAFARDKFAHWILGHERTMKSQLVEMSMIRSGCGQACASRNSSHYKPANLWQLAKCCS